MKTFYTYLTLVILLLCSFGMNIFQFMQDKGKGMTTGSTIATSQSRVQTTPQPQPVVQQEPQPQPATDTVVTFAEAERTLGCDLSHWDGEVDWVKLKKSKVEFIFVKATQGDKYVDPKFEENWVTSKNYGFERGAYHFFEPGKDAKAQAEHFLKTVGHVKGDLVPVLDIEIAHGVDPQELTEDIKIWINTVNEAIGRYPIIYTDRGFWDKNITDDFSHCALWLAQWETTHTPYLPKGWKKWAFWQYTETGSVNGVQAGTNVDLSHFNGHIGSLRNYTLD